MKRNDFLQNKIQILWIKFATGNYFEEQIKNFDKMNFLTKSFSRKFCEYIY